MILLILLYLFFFSRPWNTFALPTDLRQPQNFPRSQLQSIFIRDQSQFDTRSIYGIIWSCLSTIFTCTWIVVHPNIPAPGDSKWAVLRRRVAIMGYVLIAPEMVIMWAGRQHYAARNLAKKHEKNHPGWTRAHAFFVIMGGFILHEGGKPVRILEARDLEELSEAGKVEWPTITEEEISDRSKGDYLSKTIVLFQTTWFIAQCIARGAYGVAVTELEVVTLAFATLIGIIYYFWWDKPLDVRCSIPVRLLEGRFEEIRDTVVEEDTGSQITSPPEVSEQEKEGDKTGAILSNALPSSPTQGSKYPAFTRMPRLQAFIRHACTKHGTVFGLGYVFIVFPLKCFFYAFNDMLQCENLEDNKTLRVPTFYSSPDDDASTALALGVCVSIVFGAIHCIAWSFHFPTPSERWAWRISAILISGLPISIIAFSGLSTIFENKARKTTGMKLYEDTISFILMSMTCLYIVARIALLVLPFIALRGLLPGAFVQLDWVSFLPHI